MAGEIWIDPVQERVVRLAGSLQQDKDFGWGILGELDKGGWVEIDQADVGGVSVADCASQAGDERPSPLQNQELRLRPGLLAVRSVPGGT